MGCSDFLRLVVFNLIGLAGLLLTCLRFACVVAVVWGGCFVWIGGVCVGWLVRLLLGCVWFCV